MMSSGSGEKLCAQWMPRLAVVARGVEDSFTCGAIAKLCPTLATCGVWLPPASHA